MKNSEKILKSISNLIENGILTSKDIRNGISSDLKFAKDKIVNKLELVSREEFEVLKKIVQKQEEIIKKLQKNKKKKIKKVVKSLLVIRYNYFFQDGYFLRGN